VKPRPDQTSSSSPPEYLTVDEVADLLRTSRKAIYKMAERGQLAGIVRVGRRLLVSRAALLGSLTVVRVPSPEGIRR